MRYCFDTSLYICSAFSACIIDMRHRSNDASFRAAAPSIRLLYYIRPALHFRRIRALYRCFQVFSFSWCFAAWRTSLEYFAAALSKYESYWWYSYRHIYFTWYWRISAATTISFYTSFTSTCEPRLARRIFSSFHYFRNSPHYVMRSPRPLHKASCLWGKKCALYVEATY